MNNVQRLEIEQDSFYTDALILLTCIPKEVSTHVTNLAKKYGISKEAVYYRIRTRYGAKLAEVRMRYRQPSREVLIQIVLMSNSTEEVQQKLGLTHWEFIGLYDRVLGVSTFHAAKLLAIRSLDITKYNPSIKDNQSMIYGMRLGDGSYDYKRKSLRIEHSYKQGDWLRQKVKMMKEAYPYISDVISIGERPFGKTVRWRSNKLQGSAVQYNEVEKVEMARNINAFGLFIQYLDDGNIGYYNPGSVLGFSVENAQIGETLQKTLKTYGFSFKIANPNYICLQRQHDIQTYLNEMVLPFNHLIPDCMQYKTVLKV